ncbi:Myosin-1 [Hypsizygus marmoreus]|uniref:Myosin-1 n=1 Tax=Hypsizygus marmoreus TaxID=39966 RepID=A0A369K702_HYPMA|nr:Myosin-1 [Hypsizygus marmoreus]
MSNLRDDWMTLNGPTVEEGDPVFSCYFKTELAATLLQLTQASITLFIGPAVDYSKKKDKKAQITFLRDETVLKDGVYKSHVVHVGSGESPNSLSRPPAKRKPGVVRPITQGKLLRAGGPDKTKTVSKPKPTARALPGQSAPTPVLKPTPSASTTTTSQRAPPAPPRHNAPPPPPPPPPAKPEVPTYRAKFAFEGQEGEMSLAKDDVVELVEKDDNGWWLVKKDGAEGWAPNNYLELVPPKPISAPAPPPPPARRAVPAAPAPKAIVSSVSADASAKPVSVFPGMMPGNGSATPWKKPGAPTTGPPPPPPPPPAKPEVPTYRAKFAFEGQEGEMSLAKDDVVELVEKDDNGWWLVKKDGAEGWAPNNYLELVPPKPISAPAPPPPPARRAVPAAPAPKAIVSSVSADASAKPVSVFPGMMPGNGSATPWKKPGAPTTGGGGGVTRPASAPLAPKPPGPPVATKPRPPPVGAKPGGKPPIPAAPRPGAGGAGGGAAGGRVAKPATAVGHLDLSAALARRAQKIADNE